MTTEITKGWTVALAGALMLLPLQGGGVIEEAFRPALSGIESHYAVPSAVAADARTTAHRHLATRIRAMYRHHSERAPSTARLMPKVALAHEAAIRQGVPVEIVLAVIFHESRFNSRAVSHAGAVGLMQVMPAVARSLAEREGLDGSGRIELSDAKTNIEFGVVLLRRLHGRYGSWDRALAHYNGGWRAFVRGGVIRSDVRVYVQRVSSGADLLRDRATSV